MSMLNFKYGLHKNLPALSSTTVGNVYITTDEQSMYVDLPDENNSNAPKRIQISQIITLESTEEWKELKPPYSETAFYYIVNKNALLKYTGKNSNNEYTWQQINSTADVQTNLNGLAEAVSTLSGTVNTNANTMNSHIGNTSNPHQVTKAQVGLSNVDNKSVATIKTEFTGTIAANNENFPTGGAVHTAIEDTKKVASDNLASHTGNTSNPHKVTKAQVGLGNVENKNVATIKSELTGAVASSNTGFPTGGAVYTAITNAKNAVLGAAGYGQTVKSAYELADSASGAAAGAQQTADAITEGATLKTLKEIEEKIDDLTTADIGGMDSYATDDELSSAVAAAKTAILGEANYGQTVKSAYTLANSANTNLSSHTSNTSNPHQVTKAQVGLGNVENKSVSTIKTEFTGAVATGNANFPTGGAVYTAIETAKGVASSNLASHTGNTSNPHQVTKAQVGLDKVNNWGKDDLLSNLKATAIADTISGFTTGDQIHDYMTSLKGGYTGTLAALNTAIGTNATNISTNATNISNLDTRLTGMIQAADALQYKGTVSAFSELPTTSSSPKPSIGWTYKVVPVTSTSSINPVFTLAAANANSGKATPVYSGDLLIATGTETNGVITSNLKWDYIPSGYNADYNPQLKVSQAVAETAEGDMKGFDKDNTVAIDLYSATPPSGATQGDLGSITFAVETGSALRIKATDTASKVGTITLGLVWGTF